MTGLQLSPHAISRFRGEGEWDGDNPVELVDILGVGERVKHTNVVANAEGFFYQYKAVHMRQNDMFKLGALSQAIGRFEGNLDSLDFIFFFLFSIPSLLPPYSTHRGS